MQKTLCNVVVKAADKGQVTAVFSTFNVVDKDGDVTLPGAIQNGAEVVISAYGHQSHYGALPVGKGVIHTSETEAILEGTFFLNTAHGRDTFEVVKELGPMGEWSYSLHDVVSKSGELDGQPVQFLESIRVKEVSPVLLGSGVNTRTLAAKALIDSGLSPGLDREAVAAWLKSRQSLQDQITVATDVVNDVIDSAERVVALRAEKGKDLSKVNAESLAGLYAEMDRLKALLAPEPEQDETTEAAVELELRSIALAHDLG